MPETESLPFQESSSLAALVAYQEGAVVSRTLVKQAGGTVTVFAFAAGEGLSEHTTPYTALLLGIEGEMEVTLHGHVYPLAAGQMIQLPAGQPHALKALTPCKVLLIMIR